MMRGRPFNQKIILNRRKSVASVFYKKWNGDRASK